MLFSSRYPHVCLLIFFRIGGCMYINTETASVTLTFEIRVLFYTASVTSVTLTKGRGSFARHVVLICLTIMPYYLKILQCIRKLQSEHESMHIYTETASVTSVTLTFEIGACFFFHGTRRLYIANSCAKLFPCIRELQPEHE